MACCKSDRHYDKARQKTEDRRQVYRSGRGSERQQLKQNLIKLKKVDIALQNEKQPATR